jgi:hypothetical protein
VGSEGREVSVSIGDRVHWGDSDNTYTVWSHHPKRGYVWIIPDGKTTPLPARVANLRVVARAERPTGQERKATGMTQALSADVVQDWKDRFRSAVEGFEPGRRFTSEDVLALVGLPSGEVGMNANNAVGAMMNGLARRRLIVKTGARVLSRRSSSHGAEILLWERS